MTTAPLPPAHPLLAPWMDATRNLTTAWGGLWMPDLMRRQAEIMLAFNAQALRCWADAWRVSPGRTAESAAEAAATVGADRISPPETVGQAETAQPAPMLAEEAAPTQEPPVQDPPPAEVAPATPRKRSREATPLRSTAPRRKAAQAPRGGGRAGTGRPKGATRH